MKKIRLDNYLAQNNLSSSREKAKAEIISGWVTVNGETIREPKKQITGAEDIIIKRPRGTYVSRGGEKLAKALSIFSIDATDGVCADLGASTGGFTDCLLKKGAKKVYAIDVGYNQLDYSLRNDNRVIVHEKTHINNLTPGIFSERIDIVTIDISFISITRIIDTVKKLFTESLVIILIKPQFEAESNEHKKGVVRKKENHYTILNRTLENLFKSGINIYNLSYSPIKGPAGNIEFLLLSSFSRHESFGNPFTTEELKEKIDQIVEDAHNQL